MTQISSFDIRELVKELQILVNSKIDKLFMENNKEMFIQLHLPGIGKKILRIETGSVLHTTEFKPKFEKASDFCLSLRKQINNARIRSIQQIDFERIIKLELEKDKKYSLILEFFSKGNIILTDENNEITSCLMKQIFSQRTIKPKGQYKYPKQKYNIMLMTADELKQALDESNKESLVKALAIDLNLGGKYAEQLCELAGTDKNIKPNDIKNINRLYSSIKDLKLILPAEFKTLNDFLDIEYQKQLSTTKTEEEQSYDEEIKKIKRMMDIQQKAIKNYTEAIKDNEVKAELLYQNYQLVDSIIKELKQIEKKHSWQEIKKKLKDHKIIKEVDEKHKEIVVELK